jgi:hypothetical protein
MRNWMYEHCIIEICMFFGGAVLALGGTILGCVLNSWPMIITAFIVGLGSMIVVIATSE